MDNQCTGCIYDLNDQNKRVADIEELSIIVSVCSSCIWNPEPIGERAISDLYTSKKEDIIWIDGI